MLACGAGGARTSDAPASGATLGPANAATPERSKETATGAPQGAGLVCCIGGVTGTVNGLFGYGAGFSTTGGDFRLPGKGIFGSSAAVRKGDAEHGFGAGAVVPAAQGK